MAGKMVGRKVVGIRIDECAQMIEADGLHEIEKTVEIGLGLTGKTDHDSGSQGRIGHGLPDPLEKGEQLFFILAAPHPFEHRCAGMLDRHVEIGADVVMIIDRVEQGIVNPIRMPIEKPEPATGSGPGHPSQQEGQIRGLFQVDSIGGGVLADDDDLPEPGPGESRRLGFDILRRAAP